MSWNVYDFNKILSRESTLLIIPVNMYEFTAAKAFYRYLNYVPAPLVSYQRDFGH